MVVYGNVDFIFPDIFYAIKKEELFHAAWNHKHKEHNSPNVIVFINRFEQVRNKFLEILLFLLITVIFRLVNGYEELS